MLAVVHQLARRSIDERGRAPSQLRPRIGHDDAGAARGERCRRAEAGEAAPDDHDIGSHRVGAGLSLPRRPMAVCAHTPSAISARSGLGILTVRVNTS